ncbi:LysR family transcriptional regulator [uncultured Rhodoferax sp.]|uniref:LysR family transcriptional regulator n=1 Tax=uncultured Rhodoferax sp. TaxID=223188 RepID=UPI0025E113EE|nr:LysR family transcriptional regulator [uncultured Rhodoferax sp.]
MDQFRQMQAFVAVVQAGSFVQAAQRLDTSKAVVSRLVLELEASLGTRLLNRTTRRLSLTDAGGDYVERCRQILEDLSDANAAASAGTGVAHGRLRINAPLTFGNLHLAPLWGEFLKLHPQVELDITLTDRVVDLVDEGYDMAVRIALMPSSSLVSRTLAQDQVLLCASPTYLRKAPPIRTLDDVAQHSVMAYSWWSGGDVWTLTDAQGQAHSVHTRPRLRANSGDTCRATALADQGLIFQPGFLVGADLQAGRLVRVLPELRGPTLGVHAVYPSRKHLPGKVRAMVDFLAQAFAIPAWG